MKSEMEQMQRLLTEANRRNAEVTAALRHQAAQNLEAQRRKDDFLATISHQLRNHLAPIRNAARFLHHKLSAESEVQWCITVIDRQISQFTRLIEELQDLTRLESGHFELNKDRLPLDEVLNQAREWIQPVIDDKHQILEIIYPLDRTELWVEADFQRLSQALENLLRNAASYASPQGRIQLSVTPEGAEVIITVRDYGREIPAALLPRIFDLYGELPDSQSADKLDKEPVIGLAVVRRIVELHGGTVQAAYLGAPFGNQRTLRLPLIPAPEPQAPSNADAALDDGSPTSRIVVVDDNEDVALTFGALLQVLGYEVRVVLDGALAIEIVREFLPHIVFLDIAMPQMDGYEVATRLRAEYPQESLRLVAVTGYGQDHDADRARQAGFDHHLLKPVDLKDLQQLLNH